MKMKQCIRRSLKRDQCWKISLVIILYLGYPALYVVVICMAMYAVIPHVLMSMALEICVAQTII